MTKKQIIFLLILVSSITISSCKEEGCHPEPIFNAETSFIIGDWNLNFIQQYKHNYYTGITVDTIYEYTNRVKISFAEKGGLIMSLDQDILDLECLNIYSDNSTQNETGITYNIDFTTKDSEYKTIYMVKSSTSNFMSCVFKGYSLPLMNNKNESQVTTYTYYFSKIE